MVSFLVVDCVVLAAGFCDHAGIDNPIAKRATQTTVISLFIYLLLLICKTCARLQIALSVIRIRKRIAKTASTFGSIDLSHKFSRIGCSRRLLKVSAEVVDKSQVRYNPSGELTFQKQISLPFVVYPVAESATRRSRSSVRCVAAMASSHFPVASRSTATVAPALVPASSAATRAKSAIGAEVSELFGQNS